jgi:archaetidylinositol phosphate synthase
MKGTDNPKRINDILLGPLERKALHWLAEHSPKWLNPDILTIIGFLGALISLAGYILSRQNPVWLWLATFGFVVNWYGDSMDGTLARFRHIERPVFGFFIDHIVDSVTQLMFFWGIGLTPFVHFSFASVALVGYLLMDILAFLRARLVDEFKISYSKMGPTEARLLAILLNTAMFFFGKHEATLNLGFLGNLNYTPYDIAVGLLGLLLYTFFFSTAITEAIRLSKAGK